MCCDDYTQDKKICEMSFETTLTTRVPQLLFRFSDGHQPHSLVGTFRKLMRDSGLLSVKLYACWDSEHWVLMLPSEY
jgi:hypothetical protein